jgi:hypothetical protein
MIRIGAVVAQCVVLVTLAEGVIASDFVHEVRPIFKKHCYGCHGEEKQKSGLRLDVKAATFKGGELYGPALIPGNASESPLIQFVSDRDSDLPMPPDGEGLSAEEIDVLTRWVNEGANWPDGVDSAVLKDLTDHWSFKPLTNPHPPSVRDSAWPKNEIDRFILARIEAAGLQPAAPADRAAWLRRVCIDLTGLPPTPKQVDAFVQSSDPQAAEALVDELLNSPRYGERWAQHWLDVVRYADTHGFEVNTEREHAWPYRDYVIRALNADTPYDQFVREQIAGDQLGEDAATGFLVTASVLLPGQIGKDEASMRLARQDAIDEIVVNIGQAFLGVTIGCARCHDHKFDPVSQLDYYSMQAFVAGVEYGDRPIETPDVIQQRLRAEEARQRLTQVDALLARLTPLAGSGIQRPMINAAQNVDRFAPVKAKRVRLTIRTTNQLEPCIDEFEVFTTDGRNIALASLGTTVDSSGNTVSPNRHELRFVNDGQYGNTRSWMSSEVGKGWVELTFAETQEIDAVSWGRDRLGQYQDRLATDYSIEVASEGGDWTTVADASDRMAYESEAQRSDAFEVTGLSAEETTQAEHLLAERKRLQSTINAATDDMVFAGKFRKPDDIHLLVRGNPEMPKESVVPQTPAALGSIRLAADADDRARRRALAEWIADPNHPLTARVLVNRIWQAHFGTGLVLTPNDFGNSSQPPSHPELLDWLASHFVANGWSLKQLHRSIVLSATYRQAVSHHDLEVAKKGHDQDADVRLLWRFPSRRMDAESIRDSMLLISGELNLKMYGRGFDLFDKRGGLTGFNPVDEFDGDGLRRMVYAHKVRRERDAVFGAFDLPDGGQSAARRRESTTPIQSLNLFNSRFTLDRSDALARRVIGEVGDDGSQQVDHVFRLVLCRRPTVDEREEAEAVTREHGLSTLCRVLFNSNEFLFLP